MEITQDDIRVTRVLIPDTEEVFGTSENETMFSDADIADFLLAGRGSVLRAAGLANFAIATSEALISKKIKTQDLQTDGPATADALIKKGQALMAAAAAEDAGANADFFEIIDYGEGWNYERPELTEYGYPYPYGY